MCLLTDYGPRAEMGKLTQTELTSLQIRSKRHLNVQVGKYTDISSMEYYDDDESQGKSQNSVLPLPIFKASIFVPF